MNWKTSDEVAEYFSKFDTGFNAKEFRSLLKNAIDAVVKNCSTPPIPSGVDSDEKKTANTDLLTSSPPAEAMKPFVTETKTEFKGDIKHTTHYVNRPIKQGDPQGGAIGMCINGVQKTIEIVNYVYRPTNYLS